MENRPAGSSATSTFGRMLVSLTPDVLRVIERSLSERQDRRITAPALTSDKRSYRGGVEMSEVEYDTGLPFLRKVTVRKASAWTSDLPSATIDPEPQARRGGRLRLAGMVSVGGAFLLAAVGLIANRSGSIPGLGSRRGY